MDSTTLDDALNSMNTRDIFTYLGKNGLAWPKKIETDLHIARYRVSQSLDVLVTAETVGAERMSNFPRKKTWTFMASLQKNERQNLCLLCFGYRSGQRIGKAHS